MNTSVRWAALLTRLVISAFAAWKFWELGLPMPAADLSDIAGVAAGVSGTLLGFLITAVALLTSVMDRKLVANMRMTGHYQRLVKETFHTCIMLLCVLVVSVVSMFLSACNMQIAFVVLAFFSLLSLIYLVETGWRFSNVFIELS